LPNSGRFSGRQDLPVSANPRATDGGVPLGGRPLASPPGDAGQRSSTNPLGPPQANQQPSAPPFGPLSERHRQQVDLLLRYWEFSTKDISYYQCEFKRWDWDPNFGPKQFAREYSMGEIKFEQPDKGLYKVNRSEVFRKTDPTNPSKPLYEPLDTPGDHWVCDGTHIYQYDYPNRVIKKRTLPPNVQGPKIINGPLPFLLSAKAADIKRRFWLRLVQPPENMRDTFWLEAYPKGREDAGNFQFVRIILDTQVDRKYLPRALVIFSPGYDPVRNPSRTTYEFEQRQVNPLHISLNVFRQSFYNIRPDSGWRVDDADIGVPAERPAARESRRGLLPSFGRR
jgi:TIGR03009 family protein